MLPTLAKSDDQTKLYQKRIKTFRHIPAEVRAEKIAKGLCYYCDQPYDRSHKYRFKKLNYLQLKFQGIMTMGS